MRVSLRGLADLTNVNAMLLPPLGPNLRGSPTYSGGLTGLDQVCTDGSGNVVDCGSDVPAPPTASTGCYDTNGNAIACAGAIPGTTIVNPGSTVTPSVAPGTLPGNVCPAGSANCSSVSCSPFGTYNATTGVCDYTTVIVASVLGIGLLLVLMAAKK